MRKYIISVLVLVFAMQSIFSDQWKIKEIIVTNNGRSILEIIEKKSELEMGMVFFSEEELVNRLEYATDLLESERVLDSVNISYAEVVQNIDDTTVSETNNADVLHQVIVFIETTEGNNYAILPYPKYSTSSGLLLSARFRNYNFLGTMERMAVNLDYEYDNYEHGIGVTVDMYGFDFETKYSYDFNDDYHTLLLKLGYSFTFNIGEQPFSVYLREGFNYIPQDVSDSYYLNTDLGISTSILLPWEIYDYNQISYKLGLTGDINYNLSAKNPISESRDGFTLGFNHSLNLGRTDLGDNNYRQGWVFKIENNWEYRIEDNYKDHTTEDVWSGDTSLNVQMHQDWDPWGLSMRFIGVANSFDETSGYSEYLRGDSGFDGKGGLFLNSAIFLSVWTWEDVWEIQGSFFTDLGLVYGAPSGQDPVSWTFGAEGFCFPEFARSFYIRISFGLDMVGLITEDTSFGTRLSNNYELSFGLGYYY